MSTLNSPSWGKASGPATHTPVRGASGPSQTPSPSVSARSGEVPGALASIQTVEFVSLAFSMPSPSRSRSSPSQMASPSRSFGKEVGSNSLDPQANSEASGYPSPSSSSSPTKPPGPSGSTSGNPSPSVSSGEVPSRGSGSGPRQMRFPSASRSSDAGPSQKPSPSVSGSRGSVPVSLASTYAPVPVSTVSFRSIAIIVEVLEQTWRHTNRIGATVVTRREGIGMPVTVRILEHHQVEDIGERG